MAKRRTIFQNCKSIAGSVLIGFGGFILYNNLAEAAVQLSRALGISVEAANTLGVPIAVGLAVSHVFQAYLFNHHQFLRSFHHILISLWPVLVLMGGTVFLCDDRTNETKEPGKKKPGARVDFAQAHSTRK
jgi:uncharacterized membrane protein